MTLSTAFLDELRARVTLSAIIAPSVKLIRAGREFKACCPFHQEKTPSFTVNDDKGFYHCFGCGAHGDAIRFLTDQRGMPFMDAVKELAAKAGLEVPAPDPRARERAERASSLTDVMGEVAAWYAAQLNGIAGASSARLSQAPRDRRRRSRALRHRPCAPTAATRSKTRARPSRRGQADRDRHADPPRRGDKDSYDRFRGRLMIPIRDPRGRVIAFGGRILGDGEPKYLNSPDTPLFDKGRTLYNLDLAAPASRTAKRLIVVEGYMDVIALDRAGIAEAVAPNGTALTEAQLERLWRLDPAPILCFDGDAAGRKAAIRAALRALPHIGPERTLRFVELPPGQDPDDIVNSGGREAMDALLAISGATRRAAVAARVRKRAPDHPRSPRRPAPAPHATTAAPSATRPSRASTATNGSIASSARSASSAPPAHPPPAAEASRAAASSPLPLQSATTPAPSPPAVSTSQPPARSCSASRISPRSSRPIASSSPLCPSPTAAPRTCATSSSTPLSQATALDRDSLVTILDLNGPGGGKLSGAMGFSFTRRDSDPAKARSDLAAAVEIIAAAGEVDNALVNATERLKRDLTDEALEEQQRLVTAQAGLRHRLASLAGTD